MRPVAALAFMAVAFLVPAARAGEEPSVVALSPAEVARLYLADDFAERASAEKALDAGSPSFVRRVLGEVRRQSVEFGLLEPEPAPVRAAEKGVEVEFRVLSMPPEILAAAIPDGDRAVGSSRLRILGAAEVAMLLDAVRRDPAAYQAGLAKATTLEGRACSCSASDRVSFVKAYVIDADVEVAQDEPIPGPDPVVGAFAEGYDVVATPSIVGHGSAIAMAVRTRLRRALRPIAEEPLALDPARKVEVPELSESRWSRVVTVPAGKTALVFAPDGYAAKPGARVVFLLTPRVVDLTAAPPAAPATSKVGRVPPK